MMRHPVKIVTAMPPPLLPVRGHLSTPATSTACEVTQPDSEQLYTLQRGLSHPVCVHPPEGVSTYQGARWAAKRGRLYRSGRAPGNSRDSRMAVALVRQRRATDNGSHGRRCYLPPPLLGWLDAVAVVIFECCCGIGLVTQWPRSYKVFFACLNIFNNNGKR